MYGLIDCNNFFVSCERVRHPELVGRPVIVLSNNDGCAVAMSNEAKALGIKRGSPLFKVKDIVERHGVVTLSGDHRFYSAVSARVMETLGGFDMPLEVYSIDEAFLILPPDLGDPQGFGRYVVQQVREKVGVPVSMGIAPSRTLAKMASHFAKKYPGYQGSCMIDTEDKRLKALELTPVDDVWGIGRRVAPKLVAMGVRTALDYSRLPLATVKKMTGVNGERTWRELAGEDCVETIDKAAANKSIMASRSFERDIYALSELEQAVAAFTSIIGKKLRRQKGFAASLGVFLATNRFHTRDPQFSGSLEAPLEEASNYTPDLATAAVAILRRLYRRGYGYKRAGVYVAKVVPGDAVQPGLFDDLEARRKRQKLMEVADALNAATPGNPAVRMASIGDGLVSMTRHEHSSSPADTDASPIGVTRADD